MEPELGALVTGEAPVTDTDEASVEAGLAEAIFLPPLNLRQGAFARRREWRVHGPRLRRLALLAASLLLATLAIHVSQIVRYTYAADAAEEETRAIASGALRGRGGVGGEGLGRRLAELRGGGAGFTATASAVFGAVKSAPNVELSALAFLADGSLRVTAAGDSPASLAELVRRIEAGGFAVEPAPRCRRPAAAGSDGEAAMMANVQIWFRGRSVREQRLLLAMAILFAIVLLWLLLVRPLGDALAAARERHGEAVIARAEAQAQAEAIRSFERRRGPALTEPIDLVIGRAASEAGFQLSRIEPESGGTGVSVAIEAVKPQAFFAWVGGLEGSGGLIVASLNATANADRTLAVQATFRPRGR
jgi:type II secretory pathway component PulM